LYFEKTLLYLHPLSEETLGVVKEERGTFLKVH